jgi:hypothetical protein
MQGHWPFFGTITKNAKKGGTAMRLVPPKKSMGKIGGVFKQCALA